MDQSPRLALSYLAPSQAQKHVTVNETFRRLDQLVQQNVLSRTVSAEPASPTEGDAYILPASPTGAAWGGFAENDIAAFQDGAWTRIAPKEGWRSWVSDADEFLAFNGASWTAVGGGGGGGDVSSVFGRTGAVAAAASDYDAAQIDFAPAGGIAATDVQAALEELDSEKIASVNPIALVGVNTTADAANKLAVASDNTLFNHNGTDHRVKVNKAGLADTASFIFQTAFSGRAEFGLTGDDDFHFKVSPDGSTFFESFILDKDTGDVAFKQNAAFENYIDISEIAVPSDPPANTARLYAKDDGGGVTKLAFRDAAGTETIVGAGGGGSNVSSVFGRTGAVTAQANDYDADEIDDATTTNKFTTAADISKLSGIEDGATADQSDAEIETAYNNQVTIIAQAEAEAGSATTVRRWTAERVKQAVEALAPNPVEAIGIAVSDETTDLTTGTAKTTFRMPYAFTLTGVRASVTAAPTGSALIVDINEGGTSILSTKLSIDATEKTSTTAASAPVISDSALADDAEITVDIDQIGSSVAGAGLKIWLIGSRT